MKIVVKLVEYKEKTVTEIIKYETIYKNTSALNSGNSRVVQEGADGEKKVTYKIKYVDGKQKSKKVLNEEITKKSVDKIVEVGTASTSNSGSSGGKQVVSKQTVYDCDGSGNGYYVITYSDGSVEYVDFYG